MIPQGANAKATIDDIRKQVERIGKITRMAHHGLNVYIEYERLEYAQIAYLLLGNRKYDGRQLNISFYDPVRFADDILLWICANTYRSKATVRIFGFWEEGWTYFGVQSSINNIDQPI